MYDRTGITLHGMKKHEKDGKQLCAFGGNVCTQRPMKTFDFCVKHILQDPTAPFKRCEYVAKGKHCGNPVKLDVGEDIRYCNIHKQKMGITPKTKKKKSEEKTPSKRGRKKEKKEESETTPESKEVKEEKSTPDVPPPSSSVETTTIPTTTTSSTITSTTIPTPLISTLSTSVEPILPYPINCVNNNNEDTDSDDYTGVNKPIDTRKEQKPPKKSPPQKRKRKFNKKPQQTVLFSGSDTESDVPTDDDECMEETYLYPPYSAQENGSQCLTEMEFLRIRKHHIESLLKLYRGRHKKMRNELERKYTEFLIQREMAANIILNEQTTINSDIKIRLKKVNYNNYYNPKNRMNDTDSVVLPTVNFPPENQQVYHCSKVEKYHESTKEPLCCHPNCFSKRLLGVEFCLQHIIYDEKQRLYVPSTGSTPLYASSSDVNTKIPKEATLGERTVVVIENANKLTLPKWQINSEQDKHVQNLLKKLKGEDDPMQIDNVPISEDLSK